MTPGERVDLIEQITDRLSTEGWARVDLCLGEFGFPTNEIWSGDKDQYIVSMLRAGSEHQDALWSLASYLGVSPGFSHSPSFGEPVLPEFWADGSCRVFISHLAKDKRQASDLKDELGDYGISGFVAHEDIEPTKHWHMEIERALDSMEALVAILTDGFHQSLWTDQEIGWAMGRKVPIVPVRLGTDPYGLFGKIQAIPGFNKSAVELAQLVFTCLRKDPQLEARLLDLTVVRLERANTFKVSANAAQRLLTFPGVTLDHLSRVEAAVKENPQVSRSWNAVPAISALRRRLKPSSQTEEVQDW